MFVTKCGGYQSGVCIGVPSLAHKYWTWMDISDTLAYHITVLINAVNGFIIQGLCIHSTIFVNYEQVQ